MLGVLVGVIFTTWPDAVASWLLGWVPPFRALITGFWGYPLERTCPGRRPRRAGTRWAHLPRSSAIGSPLPCHLLRSDGYPPPAYSCTSASGSPSPTCGTTTLRRQLSCRQASTGAGAAPEPPGGARTRGGRRIARSLQQAKRASWRAWRPFGATCSKANGVAVRVERQLHQVRGADFLVRPPAHHVGRANDVRAGTNRRGMDRASVTRGRPRRGSTAGASSHPGETRKQWSVQVAGGTCGGGRHPRFVLASRPTPLGALVPSCDEWNRRGSDTDA